MNYNFIDAVKRYFERMRTPPKCQAARWFDHHFVLLVTEDGIRLVTATSEDYRERLQNMKSGVARPSVLATKTNGAVTEFILFNKEGLTVEDGLELGYQWVAAARQCDVALIRNWSQELELAELALPRVA